MSYDDEVSVQSLHDGVIHTVYDGERHYSPDSYFDNKQECSFFGDDESYFAADAYTEMNFQPKHLFFSDLGNDGGVSYEIASLVNKPRDRSELNQSKGK